MHIFTPTGVTQIRNFASPFVAQTRQHNNHDRIYRIHRHFTCMQKISKRLIRKTAWTTSRGCLYARLQLQYASQSPANAALGQSFATRASIVLTRALCCMPIRVLGQLLNTATVFSGGWSVASCTSTFRTCSTGGGR